MQPSMQGKTKNFTTASSIRPSTSLRIKEVFAWWSQWPVIHSSRYNQRCQWWCRWHHCVKRGHCSSQGRQCRARTSSKNSQTESRTSCPASAKRPFTKSSGCPSWFGSWWTWQTSRVFRRNKRAPGWPCFDREGFFRNQASRVFLEWLWRWGRRLHQEESSR